MEGKEKCPLISSDILKTGILTLKNPLQHFKIGDFNFFLISVFITKNATIEINKKYLIEFSQYCGLS